MKIHHLFFGLLVLNVLGCAQVEREQPRDRIVTSREERRVVVGDPVQTRIVARQAPEAVVVRRPVPARRVERRTTVVAPGPNHVWIRGHWAWRDDDWTWVPGQWVERPAPGSVWAEGEFMRRGDDYVWVPGYWR